MQQHQQLDTFVDMWLADYRGLGKKTFCRAGCAGCCRLAVHATLPEAASIAGQLSEVQAKRLSDYIGRLQKALSTVTDLRGYLRSHRQTVGPCPFLDARGYCSIYLVRPLSCRALLATRPADWCTVDFADLDSWDRQAYEQGLDRQVVAWPTHFVAATQDFGRELEGQLLESMRQQQGWALAGNFAAMAWLERRHQLSRRDMLTKQQLRAILAAEGLNHDILLCHSE